MTASPASTTSATSSTPPPATTGSSPPAPVPPVKAVDAEIRSKPRASENTRGVVVVRVKRWAKVTINDQPLGYAPVRKELPPGQHQVVLENDSQREVIKLNVVAGKTSTVMRDW